VIAVPLSWRVDPDDDPGGYERYVDLAPRFPIDYQGERYFGNFYGGIATSGHTQAERILYDYGIAGAKARRRKVMRFLAHRRWIRLTSKTRVTAHGKFRRISHRYSAGALRHCLLRR
jgi:hypothetical protein